MLAIAFTLNIAITWPLTWMMLTAHPHMAEAYGPDSDARRILACLYFTIGLASLFALAQMGLGNRAWALHVAWVLFPVQIVYKLATWPAVGLSSPVVVTNLVVVAVLVLTLAIVR